MSSRQSTQDASTQTDSSIDGKEMFPSMRKPQPLFPPMRKEVAMRKEAGAQPRVPPMRKAPMQKIAMQICAIREDARSKRGIRMELSNKPPLPAISPPPRRQSVNMTLSPVNYPPEHEWIYNPKYFEEEHYTQDPDDDGDDSYDDEAC